MSEPTQRQTELDEALDIARGNAGQANYFYDAFLNAQLFMPVLPEDGNPAWRRFGNTERFKPLFLTYEETKVVPLFDRLERLQAWAGERALDYLELKCHTLLLLFSAEIAVVLNLGTQWSYYFAPETLEQLRTAMKPIQPV